MDVRKATRRELLQDHLQGGPDHEPILLRINCTSCVFICGDF